MQPRLKQKWENCRRKIFYDSC